MIASVLLALHQPGGSIVEERAYQAWLETPGGPLEFGLVLERKGEGAWNAFLRNGEERIEVPKVEFDGTELLLDMPHYDSRLRARVVSSEESALRQAGGDTPSDEQLEGNWEKRRSEEETAHLPFFARRPAMTYCYLQGPTEFSGRWSVHFETEKEAAVAVLSQDGTRLSGTFLTVTGDYRYLAGWVGGEEMSLSCFDGAHAFLFKARLKPDGTLAGDFWSGDWHHETWTAKRDDTAQLADPFVLTKWNGTTKLADLAFPDLDGTKRSLGDFAGKATLLVVFGSWCPNCNDEAKLLKELDAKYKERGLRILGLAFELTGEPERDAEQVRIFARRHELALPFFLCGTADKDEATKALALVDRVRAFPTTIFVGADGLPKAIHSGFAGPATGEEHQKLRRDFEARIEALVGAPPVR